jgi:hypothetical protein
MQSCYVRYCTNSAIDFLRQPVSLHALGLPQIRHYCIAAASGPQIAVSIGQSLANLTQGGAVNVLR